METNVIDLILIFSIVISGSLALFQGFFRELLALLGWVVAFVNIKIFFASLSKSLVMFIENDSLRDIVVISTIFILTLIIWRVISIPILKIFKSTSIGYLDKLLGFFFGVFRVFVLACIIYIYTLMPNEKKDFPEYTKDSKILPLIENLSVRLTDNFEFFNKTEMQDIIKNDNKNESIENK
ncbi:MAG: CvpA family protein [Alphaproteobacteria bacterium]